MNWLKWLFGRRRKRSSAKNDGQNAFTKKTDGERMAWGIEKARLTLHYFKKSITAPRADQSNLSLKANLFDGSIMEQCWLDEVSFDDVDNFYGRVVEAPASIQNVHTGKHIGVPLENVADWMIIEEGRLIGGYTIRAIRDGLDDKKKKAFDQRYGYLIDEGVDYFEHDFNTPEGAILSIEDAYETRDITRVMACKDFEAEARLMLSHSKQMGRLATDPQIVIETEEAMKSKFMKFIDDYGFPSFRNVKRAFPSREFLRDDLCIVTEICQYPDKTKSTERLYVSRKNGQWKVLNPVD